MRRSEFVEAVTYKEFDISRHVPDGRVTDANIDDAIDAAKEAAYEYAAGSGLSRQGAKVTVPRGRWFLSRPHEFPAPGQYEMAVSFAGAGMNDTVFWVGSDTEDIARTPVFTFGTYDTQSPLPHTMYLNVSDFTIIGNGGDGPTIRHGLRFYTPVNPLISRIRVRGLRDEGENMRHDDCYGISFLESLSGVQHVNSQFPKLRDCDIYGCGVGLYVLQAGPISIDNVNSQGNRIQNAVFEGSLGSWRFGGVQSGSHSPDSWFGGRQFPSVVSGWSDTTGLPSGTGATCTVASGHLCTLNGVSGLEPFEHDHAWIELIPTGSSPNEVKVRGVYKIERVLSATSCIIHKGSNHTAQSGLGWQVRQSKYDNQMVFDDLYDEGGTAHPMFGFYRTKQHASYYRVENCTWSAPPEAPMFEVMRANQVISRNNSGKGVSLRYVGSSDIDTTIDRIWADEFSYAGLRCLHDPFPMPGGGLHIGGVRDAGPGGSVSLRSYLRELGAVAIWDARIRASMVLSSGDTKLDSIEDLMSEVLLTPRATTKADYIASSANFGNWPCISIPEGHGATRAQLIGTIPANKLPTKPYSLTMILVFRLPNENAVDRRFQIVSTDGGGYAVNAFMMCDGPTGYANGSVTYFNHSEYYYPGNGGNGTLISDIDTNAHVVVGGMNPAVHGQAIASWEAEVWANVSSRSEKPWHKPGADLAVSIGTHVDGDDNGAIEFVLAAVIPHALSRIQHQKLIDLTCNEIPTIKNIAGWGF